MNENRSLDAKKRRLRRFVVFYWDMEEAKGFAQSLLERLNQGPDTINKALMSGLVVAYSRPFSGNADGDIPGGVTREFDKNEKKLHEKKDGVKVRYLSRLKLSDLNVDSAPSDPSGREHAKSLLLKRWAFSHENEVRLICYNRDKNYDEDVIHFPISPVEVFDQIIFDPRMAVCEYEKKKEQVVKLGYPSERIKRSGLYEPPDLIFDVAQGSVT